MKDEIRSLIAEMDGKKLEIDTVTHMYKFIDQVIVRLDCDLF